MASLAALQEAGQSVWLDYLSRPFVRDGGLQGYIDQGVRGVTANPTIIGKAVTGSADYDEEIRRLARERRSAREIYETIVGDDIRLALARFRPVYEALHGADGFVSLEVEPALAYDTTGTIARVEYLNRLLGQPNAMIKVPATPEGIPAIRELTRRGINVNVTLIFSLEQYRAVTEAYLRGLELCLEDGGDLCAPASVASFFISRIDSAVDPLLTGHPELQGTIALASATLAYAYFQDVLSSPRWQSLAELGAHPQRPLWASTSTKNPAYPDTLYVDNLVGADTVNTMPLETLGAVLDHGTVRATLTASLAEAHQRLAALRTLSIDLDEITLHLTRDGVRLFAEAYDAMMAQIEAKRAHYTEDKAA